MFRWGSPVGETKCDPVDESGLLDFALGEVADPESNEYCAFTG